MGEAELLKKLNVIQYHQKLIVSLLDNPKEDFYKLVIKQGLAEEDVHEFYILCERLSIGLEEQKAEGFVYYHPLYQQFTDSLHRNLSAKEVIQACISQGVYLTLMYELKNYIS
jgi:hypothetical protein